MCLHRAVAASLVGALCLGFSPIMLLGQEAHLPGLVPWPLLNAGIPVEIVPMSKEPATQLLGWQDIAASADGTARFGVLPIGTGADSGVDFVLLAGEALELLVDVDNDEDLTNDFVVGHKEQINSRSFSWFFVVRGEYETESGTVLAQTALCVTAMYSYATGDYTVGYSGFAQRQGYLEVNSKEIAVAMTTVRTDATYEKASLCVAVDYNGDGHLDSLPGSPEAFLPGELIQIETLTYRVAAVSPWGDYLELEPVGRAPERKPIAVGASIPVFTFPDEHGHELSLEDFSEEVVVLLFLPDLGGGACTSCSSSTPYLDELNAVHAAARSFGNVLLIVVTPEGGLPADLSGLPSEKTYYVSDSAVCELYRRQYATIVVAPGGVIEAQDDVWSTSRWCNGRPRGKFDKLSTVELIETLQRLTTVESED